MQTYFFLKQHFKTHLTLSGSRNTSIVVVLIGMRAPQRENMLEKTANPYG